MVESMATHEIIPPIHISYRSCHHLHCVVRSALRKPRCASASDIRSSTFRSDTETGITANHERLTGYNVSSRAWLFVYATWPKPKSVWPDGYPRMDSALKSELCFISRRRPQVHSLPLSKAPACLRGRGLIPWSLGRLAVGPRRHLTRTADVPVARFRRWELFVLLYFIRTLAVRRGEPGGEHTHRFANDANQGQ